MHVRHTTVRAVISGCVPLERTRRIVLLRGVESNVSMVVLRNVGQTHPRALLFWERIFSIWEKGPCGGAPVAMTPRGEQDKPSGLAHARATKRSPIDDNK
jgi:hypothetical protein